MLPVGARPAPAGAGPEGPDEPEELPPSSAQTVTRMSPVPRHHVVRRLPAFGASLGGSTYRPVARSTFVSAADRFDVTYRWTSGSG